MKKSVTISVRLDAETKLNVEAFAQKAGLSVSSLIVMALKQVIVENRINVSPDADGTYETFLREIEQNQAFREEVLKVARHAQLGVALKKWRRQGHL